MPAHRPNVLTPTARSLYGQRVGERTSTPSSVIGTEADTLPRTTLVDARAAAIGRAEFDADVRRLRTAAELGLWLWLLFTPFDWLFTRYAAEPGTFGGRMTFRLLGAGFI